jgi:hypothetical protein
MVATVTPASVLQKALERGWGPVLVQRALAAGFTPEGLDRAMEMDISLSQAEQLIARQELVLTGKVYTPAQEEYIDNVRQGRYHLEWLNDTRPAWGVKAERRDPKRGLTLIDVNDAYAGEPETSAPGRSMAARGATLDPDAVYPDMGYIYNEKYQVWADNIEPLYEEAVQRQWSATRDIPWDTLTPLPDDLERAQCQISTFLTEVEMIASDFPAKWLWRMNQHYHEVKMFLCTQAMDEARHLEVFRKRALANGGGLLRCRAETEMGLAAILLAPTYIQGSFLMHVGGEGLVLDLFRAGEFLAQNKCEKEIYRLCMQDEARHVSYGTMHLKYFLEHHPDRASAEAELHVVADAFERGFATFLVNPWMVEPLAVLAGGGIDHIDRGMDAVKLVWKRIVDEYLNRCDLAGFDRRSRIKLPAEPPY